MHDTVLRKRKRKQLQFPTQKRSFSEELGVHKGKSVFIGAKDNLNERSGQKQSKCGRQCFITCLKTTRNLTLIQESASKKRANNQQGPNDRATTKG